MTILTTADICKMTAAITGGEVKRAATKEKAAAKLQAVLSTVVGTEAAPFLARSILSSDAGKAAEIVASLKAAPEPTEEAQAEVAPEVAPVVAGKSRRAALALIEAEVPAPAPKTKKVRAEKLKAERAPKGPSKRDVILDMVCRPEGATEQEICDAIGWKACLVTLRRAAEAASVTLRAERAKGQKSRYFGTRAA